MQFVLISEQEKNRYNDFIAAHPSGSFLQSWDWGDWQEQLGHRAYHYGATDDEKTILLAAQVMEIKLGSLNQHYLYLPYGPLTAEEPAAGTEKLLGKTSESILKFFIDALAKQHPRALFIRVEPKQNLSPAGICAHLQSTPRIQPGKTLLLDVRQNEENLLAAMHPKTRYNIKVALRHGVTVEPTFVARPGHGLNLKEALDLIIHTAKRQNFRTHGRGYYQKLIDFFALPPQRDLKLSVYKAAWRSEVLAAAIMIDFGSTRTYLFGGSSQHHRNVMAPYLLHWQAIKDAAAQGLNFYDFWGTETSSGAAPGFVRFKESFGGASIEYPPPTDLILKPLWYNAYRLLRAANRLTS